METVQLQCGHCEQLMAVSVEHLGTQVHCPHCQQIVQVPAANALDGATQVGDEEGLPKLRISSQDTESILTEAGNDSEDVFGRPPPRLEIGPATDATAAYQAAEHSPVSRPVETAPLQADEELPAPTVPRRREERSLLVPILFMFLIPYCLATTGFIAFLLYNQNKNRFDPLERLPDPKPGEGGPRQIQHNLDVKLRTPLGQPVRVGAVEVTPLKIQRTPEDDLTLFLNMRNVSTDIEFNPMVDDFVKYRESLAVGRPYTFLEPLTGNADDRLYGGFLEWHLRSGNDLKQVDHSKRIRPGQEMLILLTTRDKDRARVRRLLDQPQPALWRVQVRRGFLPTSQGPRSASAVIGVDFNSSVIEKAT